MGSPKKTCLSKGTGSAIKLRKFPNKFIEIIFTSFHFGNLSPNLPLNFQYFSLTAPKREAKVDPSTQKAAKGA